MSNANYCACKANGDDLPTVAKIIILYNTPISLLQYSILCLTMQSTKIKFYFISFPLHISKMGDAPCDLLNCKCKITKIYITKKNFQNS